MVDHRETLCQTILRSRQPKMSTLPTCQVSVILSVSEESDKPLHTHRFLSPRSFTPFWMTGRSRSTRSFTTPAASFRMTGRTVSFYQILHYACGFVQDDSELDSVQDDMKKPYMILQCQRSTNTVFLYYSQNQCIIGKACSWTSLQNTDYEQETFVSHCIPASS